MAELNPSRDIAEATPHAEAGDGRPEPGEAGSRPDEPRPSDPRSGEPATGLYVGADRVEAAWGRFHRGRFELDRWLEAPRAGGEDPADSLRGVLRAGHVPDRRLVPFVPSALLSTRYLRLPSRDPRELRAMIPHQLAASLPVEIADVAWNASVVDENDEGSLVLVHVVRRDQLESYLDGLGDLGGRVWAAIPEGRMLARALGGRVAEDEATVLTWRDATFHLLVLRGRRLLYHRSYPGSAELFGAGSATAAREMLMLSLGEIQASRTEYERLTGRALPEPFVVMPDGGAGTGSDALARAFTEGLAERLGAVRLETPAGGASEAPPASLAVSLAELASLPDASVLPDDRVRNLRRREGARELVRTGLIVAGFALVALGVAFGSLKRGEARLELLRARVAEEEAQVNEIETMRRALDAHAASIGSDFEVLRVLASIEATLPEGLFVQKVSYSRGGEVRLSGAAAELGIVNDLARALAADPLWKRADILRLQRPGRNPEANYQFDLVAELAANGGSR